MANRQAQLDALASQNGYQEGYNNDNIFTQWQTDGAANHWAWCDSFAQWGANGNGGFIWQDHCQFGSKGDAYCPWTKSHAEEYGLWHGADETPQPGWQVLYSWNRNGFCDHIGTVWDPRSYPSGPLVALEGNTGVGEVKYCLRDSTFIVGFAEIPADDVTPPAQVPVTPPSNDGSIGSVSWPVLSFRTRSSQPSFTKLTQQAADVAPDGDFYMGTRSAVIVWQRDNGLQYDGVVGLRTSTALVQAHLNWFNYNAGAVDGDCGAQTTAAIKAFQTDAGITVDGDFGGESANAMCQRYGI